MEIEAPPKQDAANEQSEGLSPRYVLRLYVSGATARSVRAISSMRRICETHLHGQYDLDVVDIYQNPEAAKEDDIIAVPTLVKRLPAPLRRLIGDLADRERVLSGLNIVPKHT